MVTIASRSSNSPPSRASTSRSSVAAARVASPWVSSPATESSSSSRASRLRVSRSSSWPWSRATVSRSPSTAASRLMTRRARSGSSHRLGEAACSRRPASSCSLPARSKELLRVGEPLAQRLQLGSVVGGHGSRLLGLGGAVQWYRAGAGCVRALKAQQAALELEDPGGRLLLKQGGHVVGEDAQQGQAVLNLLGVDGAGGAAGALGRPVVLELLQAALQGLGTGHGPHPARGEAEEAVEADAGSGQGEQHVAPGGAAGAGGGVQQGLEGPGGDQQDGQQAQAPRPDALAPLVGQVPFGGLDGPALGVAVELGQGGLGVVPLVHGHGRERPGAQVVAAPPSVGPRPLRPLVLNARGGFPDRHPPPSPARVMDRPALSSHTCQSGPTLMGIRVRGGEFPFRCPPRNVSRGWSSSCSSAPCSPPSAGRCRPAGRPRRARPARPPPSRPPTPATTRPPTARAARPRTPQRSRPATASWP